MLWGHIGGKPTPAWEAGGWKDLLEEVLLEAEIGKTLGQIGQELGVDGNQSRLWEHCLCKCLEVRESKACSGI